MSQALCDRCGEALPEGARFCPNCGAAVRLSGAEERKVVTVVFVDMTASTELSAMLDAERFREVLSAFFETVSEGYAAFGGRAASFVGDAVLGVFGIPQTHDDDALRGLRAALAIVERVERLGSQLGLAQPLQVRVGVNTGPVALGTDPADRNVVIGAEVHLAARLQQAAEPGEVLVGERTWLLTREAAEFGERRRIEAKGFEEEISAWPVRGIARGQVRGRITMVNRERELALLTDTFERVVERERAHLVTLLGEPGIGKSRVVEEFLTSLPPEAKVLRGRSSVFEEDATFAPVAQMLLAEIGEDHDAPPDRVVERLADVVARAVGTHALEPDELEEIVRRLAIALGIGGDSGDERRYRSGEVRSGLLAFLSGLGRSSPVVLVFEDLHQAAAAMLETVELLVKEARRVPLLVLGVARWELLEERPNWAGGLADAVTLWVEPLSVGDATQLAREAGERFDEDEAERIARHAGGNPFFIVETAAMLRYEQTHLPPTGESPTRLLPATVQAVVAARIDHLPDAARDIVRKASVFARATFDLDELALIATPAGGVLRQLEDEEILVPDEERSGRWGFRHEMLRAVAYESLAKRERQRLHLQLADRLADPATAERYPRTIAYHLEQAARSSLDLNPRDRRLAERAVTALAYAGDVARRRLESQVAVDLYDRALALAGPEPSWGSREAWILSLRGESQYWMGEFPASADSLRRALELDPRKVLIRAHASRYLADISLTVEGQHERAAALFEESLAASRELGNAAVLARTLLMAGWAPYWANDLDGARAMFGEALQVARSNPEGDAWAEARALVGLSSITSPVGDEQESLELALEALEIGRESNDAFTTAVARENVANSLRRMMRLDEALEHADAAIRTFRELGARWELASGLGDRGMIRRLQGMPDEAESDLREAYRICRELNERALVSWTASELARTLLQRGDLAGARQVLDEPSARLASQEPGSMTAMLTAEALLARAEGDLEGAEAKAKEALREDREQGWPNPIAAQTWLVAAVFGAEAAGGDPEVEQAGKVLEAARWHQALAEPELARGRAP